MKTKLKLGIAAISLTALWTYFTFAGTPRNFVTHTVTLKTSDGFHIAATLTLPAEKKAPMPGVILIHQGGSNRGEWAPYTPKFISAGYAVLAYDVRGHGQSDKVDDIFALFDDPNQAPRDLQAAIAYLRHRPEVDSSRIAVVGASIGANLACVASAKMGVKTAVAISGKTSAVYHLAGTKKLKLKSIFYIASAGDQGGKRAAWARELYDQTAQPRKIRIVKNSSAHGVHIFGDDPTVVEEIIAWLKATL